MQIPSLLCFVKPGTKEDACNLVKSSHAGTLWDMLLQGAHPPPTLLGGKDTAYGGLVTAYGGLSEECHLLQPAYLGHLQQATHS